MRLHLPKGLLAAILAAFAALPGWAAAVTIADGGSSSITLTSAGEQLLFDGTTGDDAIITYSGNISVDGTHWCGPGVTGPAVNTSSYYVKLTGNLTDSETSNSDTDVLKFNGYANEQWGTTVGNNVVWELSGAANTYSGNIEVGHGGDAVSYSQLTLSTAFTQTSGFPAVKLTHNKTILNIGASMTLAGLATDGTPSDCSVTSTLANNTLTLNVGSGSKTFNGSVGVGNYFTETNYGEDAPGTTSSALNLTKTGDGTQVINGQVNLGAVSITGGKLALNTGSATSFSSLEVQDATLELSGSQTAITVGTAEQAGTSAQRQSYNGKSPRFRLADGASLTINGGIWLNNATFRLEYAGNGGGTLTMYNMIVGYSNHVAHGDIGAGTTLRVTGTASTSATDAGFIIWNGSAHNWNVDGSLVIDHKMRIHGANDATASSATFNVGSNGLLQLSEGIDFVSSISSIASLGTINVNGGTLAIGGSVEESKATVNLSNGAKVVALDATTLSGQQFTIADDATVTFSGKGVDGSADNTLTLTQAINKDSAVIQALGNVALNAGGTVKQLNVGTSDISANVSLGGDSAIGTLTGSGALKSTAGTATVSDASGFTGKLESTGGQISLYAEDASVSVEELTIGTNGQTLAYTGQMELGTVTADKVSIGESNAKFQGNLNITGGLTVQVGSNGQTGGLNMAAAIGGAATGTLTLGSATGTGLELNLSYIPVMTTNDTLTLFTGVDRVLYYEIISAGTGETEAAAVTLSDPTPIALTETAVDASNVFNNVDSGYFTVKFVGNNVILTASSNVPEPTTATLSLLALMGLAARRRRRKA